MVPMLSLFRLIGSQTMCWNFSKSKRTFLEHDLWMQTSSKEREVTRIRGLRFSKFQVEILS